MKRSFMKKRKKPAILNFGHILLDCRFDVWIRLLIENHFHIREDMDSCHEYKLSDPATGKYMEFFAGE